MSEDINAINTEDIYTRKTEEVPESLNRHHAVHEEKFYRLIFTVTSNDPGEFRLKFKNIDDAMRALKRIKKHWSYREDLGNTDYDHDVKEIIGLFEVKETSIEINIDL